MEGRSKQKNKRTKKNYLTHSTDFCWSAVSGECRFRTETTGKVSLKKLICGVKRSAWKRLSGRMCQFQHLSRIRKPQRCSTWSLSKWGQTNKETWVYRGEKWGGMFSFVAVLKYFSEAEIISMVGLIGNRQRRRTCRQKTDAFFFFFSKFHVY